MGNLLKLPFAVRLASLFAVFALVFSFFLGFISGIGIGLVLLRTLIFFIVFFALGYGISFVLQQFIPELYTVVATQVPEEQPLVDAYSDTPAGVSGEYEEASDRYVPSNSDEASGTADVPSFDSGLDSQSRLQQPSSAMGKHLLEEKGFKYEPKIMAEAIRTMMSRDDS